MPEESGAQLEYKPSVRPEGRAMGIYSETLNNEYIERIHQVSYSSLSYSGMLQIFSFFTSMITLEPSDLARPVRLGRDRSG